MFDWHGFSTREERDAFARIFKCVGSIGINQILVDAFRLTESQEQVVVRWVSLVAAAQEKFFCRGNGQKRWYASASAWMYDLVQKHVTTPDGIAHQVVSE